MRPISLWACIWHQMEIGRKSCSTHCLSQLTDRPVRQQCTSHKQMQHSVYGKWFCTRSLIPWLQHANRSWPHFPLSSRFCLHYFMGTGSWSFVDSRIDLLNLHMEQFLISKLSSALGQIPWTQLGFCYKPEKQCGY